MSKHKLIEIQNKSTWEDFVLSKNPGTFLQSWNWGETNKQVGYKVFRFGLYKDSNLLGVAQLIHQPARRGAHYLIPGGPVVDYKNLNLVRIFIKLIKNFAVKKGVWFVRIRPDVKESLELKSYLKKIGLIYAPMHVHGENTIVLDIKKSENELLTSMRKTTRYLIRKSLKEGYSVNISDNPADAKILIRMQNETVKRHGFIGFSEKVFKAQIETFGKSGQGFLIICRKGSTPLVAAIVILYGLKAFYHHSASSNASIYTNASYFTQWQIIKKAKEKGMSFYDFWGIAPNDNPNHRFAGVTVFKKGFGGEKLDWLHAHDIPISRNYWLTYVFETLRRKIRHL